jgi:hypothetical protein
LSSVILLSSILVGIVLRHILLLIFLVILSTIILHSLEGPASLSHARAGVVCRKLVRVTLVSVAVVGWVVIYHHLVREASILSDGSRICHVLGSEIVSAKVWSSTEVVAALTATHVVRFIACVCRILVRASMHRVCVGCQIECI